jgi:hypothetical protein
MILRSIRKSLLACALLSAPFSLAAQQQPAPAASPAPAATTQAAPQQPTPAASPAPAATPPAPQQSASNPERDSVSLGVFGWMGPSKMHLRKGSEFTSTRAGDLDFHDSKNKPGEGAVLTIPVKEHYLRFSFMQLKNTGNTNTGKDINLFAGDYDKGTYLATRYRFQNGKISFDFLSWPFPFEGRKFRIRTLWEVQYTSVKGSVDAPLKPTDIEGGNTVESNKFLIWPSLGMGAEYRASKYFRVEAQGSGFAIPGRPNLWDVHAGAVARLGKVELTFGGKAFHFRLSKKTENLFIGTLAGAYVGVAYRFE